MKRLALLSSSLVLFACGDGGKGAMPDMMPARPTLGAPLSPMQHQWTWVDIDDAKCDDGSPTGIAINGGNENLIVFFNGGGACWDYLTCWSLNTASHGPFGKAQFDGLSDVTMTGTIFDRSMPENPFKDWSFVFIPYCTGDVHTGDNIVDYGSAGNIKTTYHYGRHNVKQMVPRIAGTWPAPGKLVVSGASAGGYGSAFNFDFFRSYWPTGKAYLLDDSGPVLVGNAIPESYRTAWYENWGLGQVLDPLCGEACKDDFSLAITQLIAKHPNDRMALLSSLEDQVIRTYLQLTPKNFAEELVKFAGMRLDGHDNVHYFFVGGETHTMVGQLPQFSQQNVALAKWLDEMVNDDAAWTSLAPQ